MNNKSEVYRHLGSAMSKGDKAAARNIFYSHIIPNPAFSHREADRLSYRVGAIDEGDVFVANRADL